MTGEIQWHKTHCARMDHGGCSLLVGVQDGKIVKIKGDPEGYLNQGYLCYKGSVSAERLYAPDRLKYPLRRIGERGAGAWQRISWEAALDEIAENLIRIKQKYGAQAVAFGVGMPKGLEHMVMIRLANLFGSPNVVASQDVCHAPREVSGMHTCGFYPVADLHHPSELIMTWGSNPLATNEEGQISSMLLKQIRNGARLIVADPRRTKLAERADIWLPFRPGTAPALALSFLHVIIEEGLYDQAFVSDYCYGFEELAQQVKPYAPEEMEYITWAPPAQLRQAARLYAGARPAALQWGNAIEHDINAFDSIRALLCLMAICGNLEKPGGNIQAHEPNILALGDFVHAALLPDKRHTMLGAQHGTIPRMMTVPPAYFRQAVLEDEPYPMRAWYGLGTNPLLTWADSPLTYQTFMKLDFMAINEIFMTPSAALADIVLPVAHQYEMDDIGHYGIGHGMILARPQLVNPPEECRPDLWILNELGLRISPPQYWYDHWQGLLDEILRPADLNYEQLVELRMLKGPELFSRYKSQGFSTPTGKVELKLSRADAWKIKPLPGYVGLPEAEDPDFPLILISAKNPHYLMSSYRWVEALRSKYPLPRVEIHPDTAVAIGIEEGDAVEISTRYGSIKQFAHITDIVDPRVVSADLGWCLPDSEHQDSFTWQSANFNMLTSAQRLAPEFGTPNLKNLPCRITKATSC